MLPETHASRYFLAGLLVDNAAYLAAFRRLNRTLKALSAAQVRSLPRAFWTRLYPKAFWKEVVSEAKAHGLSPYLLLSLIRQESAFNPRAVSRAGARGLMQLMPATARSVARQVRLRPVNLKMLFEPRRNIPLGTHFFAAQLRRFQGNRIFALAAYNAGPGRVDRWRQRWPTLPMDEFVEHIPIHETRLYVKLILRNILVYEYLYQPVSDA